MHRTDIRIPRKTETPENEKKMMIVCVSLLAQQIRILCVACRQRNLAGELMGTGIEVGPTTDRVSGCNKIFGLF